MRRVVFSLLFYFRLFSLHESLSFDNGGSDRDTCLPAYIVRITHVNICRSTRACVPYAHAQFVREIVRSCICAIFARVKVYIAKVSTQIGKHFT